MANGHGKGESSQPSGGGTIPIRGASRRRDLQGWARRDNGPGLSPLAVSAAPPPMTVAPSSPANGSPATEAATLATQQPSPASAPELDWLESDLRQRLRWAAEVSGRTMAAMCEAWLREGLERFEALQPRDSADGSGRCSLRTGTCTLGPVPLPVQQEG